MKLEELARLAGVSKATANIILSGKADHYKISQPTRNKVMALVKKYHYTSDEPASKHSDNSLLALVIPSLTHHGFARLTHEVEVRGRELGFQCLLCCSQDSPDIEKQILQELTKIKVQGVMTVTALWDDSLYLNIQRNNIRVVAIDRRLPGSSISSIISNEQEAARVLCQILLKNKPAEEPLVYFGGVSTMECSEQRLSGIHLALEDNQATNQDIQLFHRDYSIAAGYQLAEEYFETNETLPQHLFTGSFTLMEGVLKYIRKHPNHRPHTLNWATFGDSYILDLLPFTIHSCRQEYSKIAEQFFTLLKSNQPSQAVVPYTLIRRQT